MRERSLSDFWRITRSDDRVRELTSVLQGADSIIGVMGSGVRAVWSTDGTSATWWMRSKNGNVDTRVFLDYSPLAQLAPPYGGQSVDEVIGYAAHEGGHVLWSDPNSKEQAKSIMTSKGLLPVRNRTEEDVLAEVLRVNNVLEDAFIDYHVGEEWPVLGEYIRWSRRKVGERRPIDLAEIAKQKNPCRNHVMNLWIACTLYDEPIPSKLSARVKAVLNFLIDKSVQSIRDTSSYSRLVKSVECWEALQRFQNKDDALPQKPQPQSPPQQGDGEGEGESGETKGTSGETGEQSGGKKGQGDESKGTSGESKGKGKDTDESEEDEGDSTGGGNVDEDGESVDETGENGDEVDENDGDGEESGHPEGEDEGADEGEPVDENDGDGGESGHSDEPEGDPTVDGDDSHSPQGGDELGSPGNLDEFDIRDLEEMPEELLEAIMDAISHELEDLSRSVAEVINRPLADVTAITAKADYDGHAADRVRDQIQDEIAEMRRVFDRQKAVQSRSIKGMPSGKIDGRSLARVGAGNFKVFKRRQILDKPDLAVGLLLDVSGSMNSYMGTVWMTAGVFAEALIRKPGINFLALTYTGSGGYISECQTTRICDRSMGRLHLGNVTMGGGTPSGEAIASIKILMDRMPERKKVIIHFTDGAPDSKQSVHQAVRMAKDAGHTVWAIAPRGYENMLQDQYGDGNWETIASISELPKKVLHLVNTLV